MQAAAVSSVVQLLRLTGMHAPAPPTRRLLMLGSCLHARDRAILTHPSFPPPRLPHPLLIHLPRLHKHPR